jgi:endonuclease/exonuclease/phosphatase family metal-dependent hydrolase
VYDVGGLSIRELQLGARHRELWAGRQEHVHRVTRPEVMFRTSHTLAVDTVALQAAASDTGDNRRHRDVQVPGLGRLGPTPSVMP